MPTERRRKTVEQKADEELEYFVVSMQLFRGMNVECSYTAVHRHSHTHTHSQTFDDSFAIARRQGTHANSNSCVFFHVGFFFLSILLWKAHEYICPLRANLRRIFYIIFSFSFGTIYFYTTFVCIIISSLLDFLSKIQEKTKITSFQEQQRAWPLMRKSD